MRFTNEFVGSCHAPFERETVVNISRRLTRIENTVGLDRIVRECLSTPEEPNRISFSDGNRGR